MTETDAETDAEKAERWCRMADAYKEANARLVTECHRLVDNFEKTSARVATLEMALEAMAEKLQREKGGGS